ncbi:MAG: hypothetical protein KY458_08275 [Actinobacteria bacterium]|nr:hypothetical protein [Actinomycetota bacterium]
MKPRIGLLLLVGALALAGCGDGNDDTAASTDTNFSGKGGAEFCQRARDFEENTKSTGDSSTPDGLKEEFEQLSRAMDDLVDEAPKEIRADAEKVGGYFQRVKDLYEKYDYDASKIPPRESDKLNAEDPKVKPASERLESYFEKVCKIDSDGDGDTDGVQQDDAGGSGEEPAPDKEPPATTVAG